MAFSSILDGIIYYVFHVIYLGYPSDILGRLWLAYDNAHPDHLFIPAEDRSRQAWKTFEDSMREYYKATGTLAALLASAISGLSSIIIYRENEIIHTLLLAGLTSSVICASACLSLLSMTHLDPINIEHHWRSSGIMYIITLSGPPAWLALAFLLFQVSILAIVWLKESTPARVIVTLLMALRASYGVASRLHSIMPVHSMPTVTELILGLLGFTHGMTHTMVNLDQYTIEKRREYRRRLAETLPGNYRFADGFAEPNILAEIERRAMSREVEQPTKEDFDFKED